MYIWGIKNQITSYDFQDLQDMEILKMDGVLSKQSLQQLVFFWRKKWVIHKSLILWMVREFPSGKYWNNIVLFHFLYFCTHVPTTLIHRGIRGVHRGVRKIYQYSLSKCSVTNRPNGRGVRGDRDNFPI